MRGGGLEPLWRSAKCLIYLTELSKRPPGTGCDRHWLLPPVTTFEGARSDPTGGAYLISPADMSQVGRGKSNPGRPGPAVNHGPRNAHLPPATISAASAEYRHFAARNASWAA